MKLYKTELGQAAFKERSPLFSSRQRLTFILFDGKKTVAEVLAQTSGMGMTQADVDYLIALGFLAPLTSAQASAPPPDLPAESSPVPLESVSAHGEQAAGEPRSERQRYFDAKPLATQLTASLGLRGFRLNLAVESAEGYQELVDLLPKIQEAVGAKACRPLIKLLMG
jgi:hypothetical protein